MRRLSSIFISAAVAISGLTLTATGASANTSGKATVKTVASASPSAVPNATILRIVRLNKTNSFLVAGIDAATAGANIHVWKIKEDLSIDTSFKPVNLGDGFEYPTASNSTCMQNPNIASNCYRLDGLTVNETANTYAVSFTKFVSVGSGMNSRSTDIASIAVGNLTTGAAPAVRNFFRSVSSAYDPTSDFASFNATNLFGGVCTSTFGATYQGISSSNVSSDGYNVIIRPDGSVVLPFTCWYSATTQNSATDYRASALLGVKASGTSIVTDTSWGTNGVLKTFDDPTKCGYAWPTGSIDSSIASNSSSKVFTMLMFSSYARQTTDPYNNQFTSYNGCNTNGPAPITETKLVAIKADGSTSATTSYNSQLNPGRWIIDSSGRWNTIIMSGAGNNATYSLLRLNTKGEQDTTLGANGQKTLTGLPSTVTINGTSVNMRYSLTGIATTATGFMFSGFTSSSTMPNSIMCNQPTNYQATLYPYYMTVENGLVTTYGTNGLGEGVTTQYTTECANMGGTGVSFINSKGQHASIILTKAIGSQTAGIKYTVWDAAQGVTSGGDGAGVIGGASAAGRVDKKVYSTRLPAAAQADSALTVLTAKQAEDLDIRTNTPKICIALTTSVVMVNPGRCVVRIIDEDTKKVIRTMTTVVKKSEVEDGTTLTTDEPIYFRQASVRLSKNALAQVAELAEAAKDASRVVVIGHSAALGEVSQYSFAISRNRANAVRAALIKAGVKAPIEIVAMSYSQPEKTAKTEKAQALNRRAEVYIFPK